ARRAEESQTGAEKKDLLHGKSSPCSYGRSAIPDPSVESEISTLISSVPAKVATDCFCSVLRKHPGFPMRLFEEIFALLSPCQGVCFVTT
ncbi:hypothetical protein RQ832_24190, partial [Roseomonas sp. DSM 102946]|nr:hypothetical protein [Roseomonas sp. DSM 102946]